MPRIEATLRYSMLVLASVSLLYCSSPISPTTTLPVTRLGADAASFAFYSGYQQSATLAIRSHDDLASAWAIIYRGQTDVPPLPMVDFTKEMVVGVAIGTQPTGGWQVVITGATQSNGLVTVDATVTRPGPSCVVTLALTQPIDLARIPTTSASIRANLTQTTKGC